MRVYLDHQAATPVLPEVAQFLRDFAAESFGNPASLHQEGFAARDALAKAREQVRSFLGAGSAEEIIFTGNGTEAVNLAIKGTAWANERRGRHLVLTAAEHPAVARSVHWLVQHGFSHTVVSVDAAGRIVLDELAAALREDTILVSVHHANHDIGTLQEIAKISALTSARGIPLFVDAVASAGWIPVRVEELGADLLAISPHRFYGPTGVGVLYRSRRARLQSLVHGGDQEDGHRAGTQNTVGIVGAGLAAEIGERQLADRERHTRALQVKALGELQRTIPYLKLNGPEPGTERHPANLNLSVEFAEGEALGLMLDVKGISVATGSACVARNQRIPPVLAAIGLPEALARGNVILTFGQENTEAEIDFLAGVFAKTVHALREMSPEWEEFQKGLIQSQLSGRAV